MVEVFRWCEGVNFFEMSSSGEAEREERGDDNLEPNCRRRRRFENPIERNDLIVFLTRDFKIRQISTYCTVQPPPSLDHPDPKKKENKRKGDRPKEKVELCPLVRFLAGGPADFDSTQLPTQQEPDNRPWNALEQPEDPTFASCSVVSRRRYSKRTGHDARRENGRWRRMVCTEQATLVRERPAEVDDKPGSHLVVARFRPVSLSHPQPLDRACLCKRSKQAA